MDSDTGYSIGDVARRVGLSVKTIRYYSDRGIVSPAGRSSAGYRRYDAAAVARLELVLALRGLGFDLSTIQRVMDRELSPADVAAAHAEALSTEISVLRLRRAALTTAARRGCDAEEISLISRLAMLSVHERRSLIDDFLDGCFSEASTEASLAGVMRSMTPELPDDPTTDQLEAWIELAELSQDSAFRAHLGQLITDQGVERGHSDAVEGSTPPRPDLSAFVREQVMPALAAGIQPESPGAEPIVSALTSRYARLVGGREDAELRHRLLARLERVNDPRRERYLRLLAVINGWSATESLAPVLDWSIVALRARSAPAAIL